MNQSIAFIGNASVDEITTGKEKVISYGGSAVNSSLAANVLTDERIYLTTTFGCDYPIDMFNSIEKISLEFSRRDENVSNRFVINEVNDTLIFANEKYLDIVLSQVLQSNHVHISCRKGVEPLSLIPFLKYQTISFDVMKFSLMTMWDEIIALAGRANFCFCNREEYSALKEHREKFSLLTFIVTHKDGVDIFLGDDETNLASKSIPAIDIQSTTGAGDSFLGAFLASYHKYGDVHMAALSGQIVAKHSLAAFGNWHLFSLKEKILKEINQL